ncbi:hypothetical protein [Octadecabacter sp. 1_MG-2023]|nr:hypothetical protein [Octadecabacter sp. 1_MG-2023]MBU2993812.1 hypothetical protein [Octadecabacter sp. B2R22]
MTQTRSEVGTIYVSGGYYDGASADQTARFVVTPDDQLICTFQSGPNASFGETETSVTAHRLTVPGLHRAMMGVLSQTNVGPGDDDFTNFTAEQRTPSGLNTTQINIGDSRADALQNVFVSMPTPCWAFN